MAYNQLPERPDESVGSWMITLLITPIPLVGFIYILVLVLLLIVSKNHGQHHKNIRF